MATAPTIQLLAQAVDPLTAEGSVSTSIGGPVTGRLEGGVALPQSAPGLVSNPRRPNAEAYYGTVEMVRGLLRAAAVVHAELPGSAVYVNDMGFREGGPIDHHGSHQAGRDVDVLFYMLDRQGAPIPAVGVPIEPDGRGWDFHDLVDPADDQRVRIDVPRTWRFVRALLEDDEAAVQRIFVVEHVRTMLLEHAERVRAPRAVRTRFEDVTCQPGYPHDDHLHVRFFCSAEDIAAGCRDSAPMYPWRAAQLRAAGQTAQMEQRPPRRRSRTTTASEAAAAAGDMHPRVRAFLDRREAWATQPHPGRRYCR